MLPIECSMPDLSPLRKSAAYTTFLLHQFIGAGRNFPATMASYRRNFVRLADKAVREYCDVRQHVLLQIAESERPAEKMSEDGRFLYMIELTNRLEDCLITTHRLYRYFEKIKNDPSVFPMDRSFRQRLERSSEAIRKVRDLVEHIDGDISGSKIAADQSTAPMLDARTKTISMGSVTLPVENLARAIDYLHTFALDFAKQRRTTIGTYEPMPKSGPVGA